MPKPHKKSAHPCEHQLQMILARAPCSNTMPTNLPGRIRNLQCGFAGKGEKQKHKKYKTQTLRAGGAVSPI